jgi:hypothetical protein
MDAGQGALIGRFEPKVLSLFVGQKLGTFIASVKTDLKVLAELIEVGKVIPVIDRTGDHRNHLVSPPGSGNNYRRPGTDPSLRSPSTTFVVGRQGIEPCNLRIKSLNWHPSLTCAFGRIASLTCDLFFRVVPAVHGCFWLARGFFVGSDAPQRPCLSAVGVPLRLALAKLPQATALKDWRGGTSVRRGGAINRR